MKKGAYLILSHSHHPITRGENAGKIQTTETCEFQETYKKRHLQSATIIMDALTREFVKNTYRQDGLTYDQVEEHVIKGYADKYKKFLELVGADIPEALLLEKEEVEAELEQLIEVEDDEGNAPQRKRKKIQQDLIKNNEEDE
ncbi:MAG: hypothetical protein ACTSPB_10485 [Candidatus Thorarchaeota archaeon]